MERQKDLNSTIIHGPGEIIAECAQGYRNRVSRGEMSPDEANMRVNAAMRQLGILAILGVPMETGSTQIQEVDPVLSRELRAQRAIVDRVDVV